MSGKVRTEAIAEIERVRQEVTALLAHAQRQASERLDAVQARLHNSPDF
ncbi:hypothetical protein [Sphaerisporangium corydalis]|uniref:DUF3618 domain-containing protein n=1 Tax=Sphaerisporangium corydalis TaxID=1441875 RepID=A0ABV9EN90_9ACTN|nr:hypothetical protein [Sphaerisporangium corydalis]